jgi:O-antigen/teichoic acid export membrane protein
VSSELAATGPSSADGNEAPVGGRAISGGLWTFAGQLAPFVFTLVVSVMAGRILGPGPLGRQSFIAFVVLTVQTICAGGLPLALTRTAGEALGRGHAGSLRGLARWGWSVAAAGASAGTAALLVIALLGATPRLAWLFGALAVAAGILHKVPGSILVGTQHWRQNSLVVVVSTAAGTLATVLALALGGGITAMLAAAAGAVILMLVWASALARPILASLRGEPDEDLPELRRRASSFALGTTVTVVLVFVVAQRSELFFLDRSSSDAQIAFYTIAFSAATMLQTLPTGMTNVFSPVFARFLGAGQMDRVRSGYSRSLRVLIIFVLPLAAAGFVLGPRLITTAYGARYAQAGDVLRILIVAVPVVPITVVSAALLAGYGKLRVPIVASAIAAVVDIASAAVLVPRFDAVGAAIANDIASFPAVAIQLVYCARLLGGVSLAPRYLLRMTLVSAVAAGAAQAVMEIGRGAGPLVLGFVSFLAVFAMLARRVGLLPRDDIDWLLTALGSRGGQLGHVFGKLLRGAAVAR